MHCLSKPGARPARVCDRKLPPLRREPRCLYAHAARSRNMTLAVRRRRLLRRLLLVVGVGAFLVWVRKLLKQWFMPLIESGPSPTQPAAALGAAPKAAARRTSGPKKFAAFLSHCKADAAMEARYLQGEMERGVNDGRSIFLDSDDLRDLTQLQQHVRDSDVLVLLQSANVLSRPYCVLELVTAIEAGVPVLGVTLSSSGYIFSEATALLTHLDEQVRIARPFALPYIHFRVYLPGTRARASPLEIPALCLRASSSACVLAARGHQSGRRRAPECARCGPRRRGLQARQHTADDHLSAAEHFGVSCGVERHHL